MTDQDKRMGLNALAAEALEIAQQAGWYDPPTWAATFQEEAEKSAISDEIYSELASLVYDRNLGEVIALIHSELGEALEAARTNSKSEHLPGFDGIEEELADVIIRVLDLCGSRGYRIGEAVVAKMAFNRTRPHRHGGKAF